MFFKFLSTFVAIALTLAPLSAHAVTPPLPLQGKVTSILKDAKAPYSGILLDPLAASKMLVDQKFIRLEVELTANYSIVVSRTFEGRLQLFKKDTRRDNKIKK